MHLTFKGGVETRLYNYMRYFLKRGDEVTIYYAKLDYKVTIPEQVRLIHLDCSAFEKSFRPLLFNWKLSAALKKDKYDYVLGLQRTYAQAHLIAPNTHRGYMRAIGKKWSNPSDMVQLYIDKQCYSKVPNIYACSAMIADELIQLHHTPVDRIRIARPPMDTEKFNQSKRSIRTQLREKYGMENDKMHFLFASTGHKRKGLDLLLELFAMPQHQSKILHVTGSPLKQTLPNIRFHGFCKEMEEIYTAVDATLHPSVYEPFGQVISESLACGTPVIISHMCGAKEVVTEEYGIVVNNFKREDWSNALNAIMTKAIHIPESFAFDNSLTLEQHMKIIYGQN
jgi:glycosyltransferase involved in cell wall biosynthesis